MTLEDFIPRRTGNTRVSYAYVSHHLLYSLALVRATRTRTKRVVYVVDRPTDPGDAPFADDCIFAASLYRAGNIQYRDHESKMPRIVSQLDPNFTIKR